MSGYLDGYGVTDARRESILKRMVVTALLVVIIGGILYFQFRNFREERQLESFRSLLEAYGLGPAVKTILRRCGVGEYATRPPLLGLDPSRAEELWPAFCEMVPRGKRPRGGDSGARFKQE